MAEPDISSTDVFRFVALRAPQKHKKLRFKGDLCGLPADSDGRTGVLVAVATAKNSTGFARPNVNAAQEYKLKKPYIDSLEALEKMYPRFGLHNALLEMPNYGISFNR
jgi:hypothetical protein